LLRVKSQVKRAEAKGQRPACRSARRTHTRTRIKLRGFVAQPDERRQRARPLKCRPQLSRGSGRPGAVRAAQGGARGWSSDGLGLLVLKVEPAEDRFLVGSF
jgi:hypothetical protein